MSVAINIVSGKGGTGKTLVVTALAELISRRSLKVICVDLDIFVRGLTTLLFVDKDESLELVPNNELCVADLLTIASIGESKFFLLGSPSIHNITLPKLGIAAYREFSVLPAVYHIHEILDIEEVTPKEIEDVDIILHQVISVLKSEFDVVLVDSRAGFDEIVASTHKACDLSISVQEEDRISFVTSINICKQLTVMEPSKEVYTLTNKSRMAGKQLHPISSTNHLGEIPFDIDVMNSFGDNKMWSVLDNSLYTKYLSDCWNTLNRKSNLGLPIEYHRDSARPNYSLEKRLSFYSLRKRIIFFYAMLVSIFGLSVGVVGTDLIEELSRDPVRLLSFLSGVVSLGLVFWFSLSKKG